MYAQQFNVANNKLSFLKYTHEIWLMVAGMECMRILFCLVMYTSPSTGQRMPHLAIHVLLSLNSALLLFWHELASCTSQNTPASVQVFENRMICITVTNTPAHIPSNCIFLELSFLLNRYRP
jgi:hypothetical protein